MIDDGEDPVVLPVNLKLVYRCPSVQLQKSTVEKPNLHESSCTMKLASSQEYLPYLNRYKFVSYKFNYVADLLSHPGTKVKYKLIKKAWRRWSDVRTELWDEKRGPTKYHY